jgi:tungstate transport system substrate-binding protein
MTPLSRSAISKIQASIIIIVIIAGAAVAIYGYSVSSNPAKSRLIISTTSSLYETGFLDALKSKFEQKYPNMNVSFISQGTGLAIQTAMRGDADMLLVHAPSSEYPFLKGGYGVNRKIVAYNFFVLVGPSTDPAGIMGKSSSDALKAIMYAGRNGTAVWVSRGDNSGTYTKEVSLWKAIGMDVKKLRAEPWYLEAGSTMTPTLKMANEKGGYTLSDTASYLTNFSNHNIDLAILVGADKSLLNVYSAMADDPRNANMTKTNFEGSMQLIRYLVSDEGQQLFADYGTDKFGKPLFGPYLKLLQTKSDPLGNDPAQLIQWISDYAFLDGSECPPQFRYQAEGLYSTQVPVPVLLVSVLLGIEQRKAPAWIRSSRA